MKNRIIALSFLLASVLTVNAQQERVSKQLYASAYKIATDSKEDVNVRKAASFKSTQLPILIVEHYLLLLIQRSNFLLRILLISTHNLTLWLIICMSMLISLRKSMHVLTSKREKSKFSRYSVMQVLIIHSTMTLIKILSWYTSIVRTILHNSPSIPTGLKH